MFMKQLIISRFVKRRWHFPVSYFRYSYGDCDVHFCIQAVSKPLSYALATSDVGAAHVHGYVGQEPSGGAFNKLWLNHNGMGDSSISPIVPSSRKKVKQLKILKLELVHRSDSM